MKPRGYRSAGAIGAGRVTAGFGITLVGLPILSMVLLALRRPESITYEVLSYQLLVVIVAVTGGAAPAVVAALAAGVLLDVLFVAPQFSIAVERPLHLVAVALSVTIAVLVSIIVDQAARRARAIERAAEETARLARESARLEVAAASAEAADQVRSALLSAVSHDVRRPLAAAMAAIGGLRATPSMSAGDRDELLDTAAESLAVLTRLVTDLLDVGRVEAGALGVSLSEVDVSAAIADALEEISPNGAAIETRVTAGTRVTADPVLLQRVLVNLMLNACRHTPHGSRIIIEAEEDHMSVPPRTRIRVIDHGNGIATKDHESVFAPFQRAGDTDNTTGLGLGLALSRGFVEGMGGTLTLHDTPGGGASFHIDLAAQGRASERSS